LIPLTNDRTYEDLQLFNRIAAGDEQAFRDIFQHYGAIIHPYVSKIVKDEATAREIVQETFLKLWTARETLTKIENPSSWLFRVASNFSISHFRKQELDKRLLKEIQSRNVGGDANGVHGSDVIDQLSAKELQALIKEAVDKLPEKRKQIYLLLREQNMSRREVAEHLNISENTVRNQLAISLQFIQDYIKKNSGYYIPVILLSASSSWVLS
jgi:RNA polymerase sigma-70 factor (ECF subfamily)